MKKIFLIGWKDVTLAFRDRAGLILMLAAPFILTLGLGFVTGRFSGSSSTGLSDIPVVLVNQDGGQLGNELVKVFQSEDLSDLIRPILREDPDLARQLVDEDQAAAAVIIPAGFTQSIIPPAGSPVDQEVVQLLVYTNPTRPTSSGVVKTIVDEYISQVEVGRIGGQVTVTALVRSGLVEIQDADAIGRAVGRRQGSELRENAAITLKNVTNQGESVQFDVLAFLAPAMALMFLMYTVSSGGRSMLAERAQGTLSRLLVSPTSTYQVLGGKIFGIFLTGVAQMMILILASTSLFQLNWGDPIAVLVLVLAAVFGAVGWGLLVTALSKTPGQVGTVGSAMMLLFGILGGSFVNLDSMPAWFQMVSRITPNAHGLNGFTTLAMGGQLADISGSILSLLLMGSLLFVVAGLLFSRRGIMQS
jgi:ABC-2 type transport system permease protein